MGADWDSRNDDQFVDRSSDQPSQVTTPTPTVAASASTQDKLLKVSVVLLVITLTLIIGGGLFSIGQLTNTNSTTSKTQDGIDIQGCRSLFNADVVTAQGNAFVVILSGLYAVAADDDAGLDDLLRVDPKTGTSLYEDTVEDIYKARDAYKRAVDNSNKDPEKFVLQCKARQAKVTTTTRPIPTTKPGG